MNGDIMDLTIKNLMAKKITILNSYKSIKYCDNREIDNAIALTRQAGVTYARICRLFKIYPNSKDEKRIKAGGYDTEQVVFPQNDIKRKSSAGYSYHKIKNYWKKLPADVPVTARKSRIAANMPQALNLATILRVKILGPRNLTNITTIMHSLELMGHACTLVGALPNVPQFVGYASHGFEAAKHTIEISGLGISTKDLYLYSVATGIWIKISNNLIDYVDPEGLWSYHDFK